jgi:hypothetical protein
MEKAGKYENKIKNNKFISQEKNQETKKNIF